MKGITKTIEQKFQGQTPEQVNEKAKRYKIAAQTNMIEFVEHLHWLKRNSRFRELPAYKDSTFEYFVYNEHGIKEHAYYKLEWAALKHPKEVMQYGIGTIIKIRDKCGFLGVKKVIAEFDKKKTINQEQIDKVIGKHALPVRRADLPAELDSVFLQKEVESLRVMLRAKDSTITEQEQQIEKLKKTVELLKEQINDKLNSIIEAEAA